MASKVYDYVLTKTAENDFDEALTYISEVLDNPESAASAFSSISELPVSSMALLLPFKLSLS